jgi:uncharacterized Fe-S cluster-containing protein
MVLGVIDKSMSFLLVVSNYYPDKITEVIPEEKSCLCGGELVLFIVLVI